MKIPRCSRPSLRLGLEPKAGLSVRIVRLVSCAKVVAGKGGPVIARYQNVGHYARVQLLWLVLAIGVVRLLPVR